MENSDDINVMQVLQTIAGAYFSVHVINLVNDTFYEYKSNDEITPFMKGCVGAAATMRTIMENTVEDEFKDLALEFSDLNTIGQRIKGHTVLMEEFMCKNIGWVKEKFILMESDSNGDPTKVIHIIIEIGDQKRKEEFLKRLLYRDALTGCLNRLAYNERMADLYNKVDDDLIYMSFDVNCLKLINDNFGHNIGDELIVGSAECLKECLGRYGKVYRTGGDEFIAILKADSENNNM